jgi:hypothetical protein
VTTNPIDRPRRRVTDRLPARRPTDARPIADPTIPPIVDRVTMLDAIDALVGDSRRVTEVVLTAVDMTVTYQDADGRLVRITALIDTDD